MAGPPIPAAAHPIYIQRYTKIYPSINCAPAEDSVDSALSPLPAVQSLRYRILLDN